jgi:hypothetical protein
MTAVTVATMKMGIERTCAMEDVYPSSLTMVGTKKDPA